MRHWSEKIQRNYLSMNVIKRSEITLKDILDLKSFDENELIRKLRENEDAANQIEIEIKYKGYIDRQDEQISNFIKNETIRIPEDFKFEKIKSLSTEALEKLKKIKPTSIGQAMRISGVRPSDISAVLIYMRG